MQSQGEAAAEAAISAAHEAAAVEPAPSQQRMREWMQRIAALAERVAAAQAAGLADDGSTGEADSISTAVHAAPPCPDVTPLAGDAAFWASLSAACMAYIKCKGITGSMAHICAAVSVQCCPEGNTSTKWHGDCSYSRHRQSSVMKGLWPCTLAAVVLPSEACNGPRPHPVPLFVRCKPSVIRPLRPAHACRPAQDLLAAAGGNPQC